MALSTSSRRPRGARRDANASRELIVPLTVAIWSEGDLWVARVLELEIASQGDTEKEALEEAMDAACAYLNTLEELGERELVFAERSIAAYESAPATIRPALVPAALAGLPSFQLRPLNVPIRHTFA